MSGPARLSGPVHVPRLDEPPETLGEEGALLYTLNAGGITVLEGRTETGGMFRFLRDQLFVGLNLTTETIPAGRFVRGTGWARYGDPERPEKEWFFVAVEKASNLSPETMPADGLVTVDLPPNSVARVWQIGPMNRVDTSGMTKGPIFLGADGAFTRRRPTAGGQRQVLGKVLVPDSPQGRLLLNVGSDFSEVPRDPAAGGAVAASPTRYATLLKGGL